MGSHPELFPSELRSDPKKAFTTWGVRTHACACVLESVRVHMRVCARACASSVVKKADFHTVQI